MYMKSRKLAEVNLFPSRNRDADIEKGHMDMAGGEGGMNWESSMEM